MNSFQIQILLWQKAEIIKTYNKSFQQQRHQPSYEHLQLVWLCMRTLRLINAELDAFKQRKSNLEKCLSILLSAKGGF